MNARTWFGLVVLIAVGGCGKNDELVHPVSWYLEHAAERDAKTAWCADDAQRQRSPDCMNAMEAKRRALVGSQKDLKPIDWGASQAKP
jgi:hypothetical protein